MEGMDREGGLQTQTLGKSVSLRGRHSIKDLIVVHYNGQRRDETERGNLASVLSLEANQNMV